MSANGSICTASMNRASRSSSSAAPRSMAIWLFLICATRIRSGRETAS
ncbi:MAG TPA: hypothetical protein DEV96_02505 [Rhodospirillum rubrum]|nr:hypothetical protein KUL73_06300 [Rhodospirillum rubrum]HCF16926.1 hypothetical protein [Rhodospirillum rubrum]